MREKPFLCEQHAILLATPLSTYILRFTGSHPICISPNITHLKISCTNENESEKFLEIIWHFYTYRLSHPPFHTIYSFSNLPIRSIFVETVMKPHLYSNCIIIFPVSLIYCKFSAINNLSK